jgi:hypothetical protein
MMEPRDWKKLADLVRLATTMDDGGYDIVDGKRLAELLTQEALDVTREEKPR